MWCDVMQIHEFMRMDGWMDGWMHDTNFTVMDMDTDMINGILGERSEGKKG